MSAHWSRVYETPAEGIVALSIQSIAIVILCSLLIHFIMVSILPNPNIPRHKQKNQASFIKVLCVLCFSFSILYCISNLTFHSIITFVITIQCKYRTWTIYLLLCQRICLYWFYIQRLKITFQHSVLRIPKLLLNITYIMTSITILAAIVMYYYFTVNKCNSDDTQSFAIIPAFVIDIFWCLFLSIWFIYKLRQTVILFNNEEEDINPNMVLLMCKLTNIIVCSSLIFQIAQWIFSYFSGWVITAVTLNAVVSNTALLFTFNPYQNVYEKYVCCLCHQCVLKWCSIKVTNHLQASSENYRLKKKLNQIGANQSERDDIDNDDDDDDSDNAPDSPLVNRGNDEKISHDL